MILFLVSKRVMCMFLYNLINSPSTFGLKDKILKSIFKEVSLIEKQKHFGTLNIVFISDSHIKLLNSNHRGINKVTDVLSFHYYDNFSSLKVDEIAGEIILSKDTIVLQGADYGLGSEKECYKLIIHSILHILGYDHEIENEYITMHNKEKSIWDKVF